MTGKGKSRKHIHGIRRRIGELVKDLEVDALYVEFWKICCTETLEDQRLIWSQGQRQVDIDSDVRPQENLYRTFNTMAKPKQSVYPRPPLGRDHDMEQEDSLQRIPQSRLNVRYGEVSTSTTSTPSAEASSRIFALHFLDQSHAQRLLQIHQYFEQVLNLKIDYYSRIALIVAFSTQGDMVTVQKIFRQWQQLANRSQSSTQQRQQQYGPGTGGKEMYSAVIRGLVGRNFEDPARRRHFLPPQDPTASEFRNHGATQIYAALELFYELLRKGGTPTFETYHSLVVGMSTFKNDMEAAELLLDHMLIKKKKPYVQVLHVMCREYTRRREFPAAERIFGMLKEYGIRPKAMTCNLMIKAVFQMSNIEALQYLEQRTLSNNQGLPEDLNARARQLKREKIYELRQYMRETGTAPDESTFSILFYGFGHLEDGYPDLMKTMVEMSQEQPRIEPNLPILTSLFFANLNHGKVKTAESILNQTLSSTHSERDAAAIVGIKRKGQTASPFGEQRRLQDGEVGEDANEDEKVVKIYNKLVMVPGKGSFHALMLAYVEQGDITGMERVLDKMIQIRQQQQQQQQQFQAQGGQNLQTRSGRLKTFKYRPTIPLVDLEADEYTANIMLLGYLKQRDLDKVDLIRKQILSRPDWKSSSLFWDREESRQQLTNFVREQSSKAIVERSLLDSDGDLPLLSRDMSLGDNVEGELDDDIEIDVATLSAKLRDLMKSSSSTSSSSSPSLSQDSKQ
ncbi:hypothetical protein EDD21DRAFT_352643 [Dissophora ornata]|nr:hypothetical protein EDD21DRAFT_352643 [Dissophora ornata]